MSLIHTLIARVAPAYTARVAFAADRWWHQQRVHDASRKAWSTRVQFIEQDGFAEMYERDDASFNRMCEWDDAYA